jgi:hypothetical protein
MSKERRETPEWQWEQALMDAYYDYRYHQVLDPLYDKFQRWHAGQLTHADLDQAIHEVHKENQTLYGLFTEKRDWLVRVIQLDSDWFDPWLAGHPPPPGIELVPQRARGRTTVIPDVEER